MYPSPSPKRETSRTSQQHIWAINRSDLILTISYRAGNASFVEKHTTLEKTVFLNIQIGSESGCWPVLEHSGIYWVPKIERKRVDCQWAYYLSVAA